MDYKKSYYILTAGLPSGFAVEFFGMAMSNVYEIPGMAFAAIGLVLMLGSILQAGLFFRCPCCKKRFAVRGATLHKFCPECGERLEGNE